MSIYRELLPNLLQYFRREKPAGLILTGIVGCGKTTLIEKLLRELDKDRSRPVQIHRFTGDDIRFREEVSSDSRTLSQRLASMHLPSNKLAPRHLIFVDEVQKTEAVFDALKLAFDEQNASFIVSGSNPAFLNTRAKARLQRRADIQYLLPFSLPEILIHRKDVNAETLELFDQILWEWTEPQSFGKMTCSVGGIHSTVQEYLTFGGLPLAYLAKSPEEKLVEVRKCFERGMEQISAENDSVDELIRIELARQNAQEFAYQGIFQRTRLRRRERVNEVIDTLINHGYLCRRVPAQLKEVRRTYLSILSFVDPGVVTYLSGEQHPNPVEQGHRIEGIIHARLDQRIRNKPLKSELGFFKPYRLEASGKTKYISGEVDFVIQRGRRVIPIEVKAGQDRKSLDLKAILDFLAQYKSAPFGVVLYGGDPLIDHDRRLIFWPFAWV